MSYPTYPNTYKTEIQVADKTISIEVGKFSEQVSSAVLVTCGETMVHTTVALGGKVNLGYFPLQVEYMEKLYAGGIIKGSRWIKREGRPSDDSVLKARVIDRTIRPLFPEGITNQIQVINTVFSFDGENDPDMLALLSTAVALEISEIPFIGPVAGVRVGYSKETQEFTINPTLSEQKILDLDLVVSGNADSIIMVEAGANEISEPIMIDSMIKAQEVLGNVCQQIAKIKKEIGKEKLNLLDEADPVITAFKEELTASLAKKYQAQIHDMICKEGLLQPTGLDDLVAEIMQAWTAEHADQEVEPAQQVTVGLLKEIFHSLMKQEGRRMIIEDKVRPDGRKPDEVRPIWCELDIFPRTHGSAMFKRGATQACTITTLGSPAKGLYVEDMQGEEVRHYLHHYNMPPFASGEVGRLGSPKRREVGHGRLAERALLPMIPSQEEFPYTIHVVSEIVSSNGSTSQASICGSTLSLMAAGVPIKKPVAGIAMGLMSDGKNYVVLSDIQGLEDHVGDMDFKVAGTKDGITAIQMDIKLTGLSRKILEEALEQAKAGRMHIMGKMMEAIDQPRSSLSKFAPKIKQLTIPADRIGELIGPGGKNIKALIEETGTQIDIEEDEENKVGVVNISCEDQAKIDAAAVRIANMMHEVVVGEEFDGQVTRIEDYGAFVAIPGNKEGLVHVSAMSVDYISDPRTLVKLGDTVHVRVAEIKEDGKIGLSMLSAEDEAKQKEQRRSSGGSRPSGGNRGGSSRSGGFRRDDRREGGRSFSDRRPGGFARRSDNRGQSDTRGKLSFKSYSESDN